MVPAAQVAQEELALLETVLMVPQAAGLDLARCTLPEEEAARLVRLALPQPAVEVIRPQFFQSCSVLQSAILVLVPEEMDLQPQPPVQVASDLWVEAAAERAEPEQSVLITQVERVAKLLQTLKTL